MLSFISIVWDLSSCEECEAGENKKKPTTKATTNKQRIHIKWDT